MAEATKRRIMFHQQGAACRGEAPPRPYTPRGVPKRCGADWGQKGDALMFGCQFTLPQSEILRCAQNDSGWTAAECRQLSF